MNFILGKKIRMTQIFAEDGKLIPVTEIVVEPNTIIRIKNKDNDGYEAIVLASGTRNKIKKSLAGLFNKLGKFRYIKEFRTEGQDIALKVGDQIGLNSFNEGDKIKITSVSKGKGFQGVVKRHGFSGTDEQHGNKDQSRMPGSIGATGPAHVFKGTRMAGRMGGNQVTISNLEIIKIDLDKNLLYVKGSFAGGENSLVFIKGDGELKIYEKPVEEKAESKDLSSEEVSVKEEKSDLEAKKDAFSEAEEAKKEAEVKEESKTEEKSVEEEKEEEKKENAPVEEKIETKEEESKDEETEEQKKEEKNNF